MSNLYYVNPDTGTIEEVDGDGYLIDLDSLPDTPHGEDSEWSDLTAEEFHEAALALNADAVEEIPR